ncbi:MAG: hypothetical protein GOVbin2604_35 [Gammaproteobacteria virus GOV_bin_2604]|nr:MAG: hypothetical protein GOVbin2604_35 [Gammaproteobacteria virus GOV_bin_2604]|tara:strand:+ start:258 stop:1214 length:957 start_codon:yes stop_codon:yes gene_type:complete
MSILVVNSLKNSAGSSPTLTIPTADGTDGQILQSSNNSGNLVFGGAQIEAQNGTNITFPASAADDRTFVTDANGNLTATAAGGNPMNTPDNAHQGERLLDRYVISGSAGNVNNIALTVPTGYTNTDLNTIRTMKVVMKGVQLGAGGNFKPTLRLLEQDGTDFFSGSGSNPSATYARFGVEGKSYGNQQTNQSNVTQQKYLTRGEVFRSTSGANNQDYFSSTTINTNEAYNASACFNGIVYINPTSSPSMISKIDFIDNQNQGNFYNEQSYLGNLAAQLASGNNTGRHPMGVQISSNTGNNFSSGVVELYGVFKDGVVS